MAIVVPDEPPVADAVMFQLVEWFRGQTRRPGECQTLDDDLDFLQVSHPSAHPGSRRSGNQRAIAEQHLRCLKISTSSILSRERVRPCPFGQMIETEYPAPAKAVASCQTRRSVGTAQSSTMMQTAMLLPPFASLSEVTLIFMTP
jgi:hypothetical protein